MVSAAAVAAAVYVAALSLVAAVSGAAVPDVFVVFDGDEVVSVVVVMVGVIVFVVDASVMRLKCLCGRSWGSSERRMRDGESDSLCTKEGDLPIYISNCLSVTLRLVLGMRMRGSRSG